MNILFVGKCSTYATATATLHNTKRNPGFQIIKFIHLLLDGFKAHSNHVTIISNVNAPAAGIYHEIENEIIYNYIPTVNVPIWCQFVYYLQAFYYTLKWGLHHRHDRIIFCDIFSSSSTVSGSMLAAKILRIPTCALVTDMITIPLTTSLNTHTLFWKMFFKFRKNKQYRSLKSYDSFVFLTKYMNEIYNPHNRPYIVMEGSVDHTFIPTSSSNKNVQRIIMYAGAIEKEYGFNELIQAFMSLTISNIELHIYGHGKFVNQLLEYQKLDKRIKYKGVVSNEQIVLEEQNATLLVNPRLSHEQFVKYSFPSKTSEYMLSGTPLLTTKLPGIPDEYFQHLYTFEEESVDGFARKLEEILSLPNTDLQRKGISAQTFVMENKNNLLQSKRILELFKQLI